MVVVDDQMFPLVKGIELIENGLVPHPGFEFLNVDDVVLGSLHIYCFKWMMIGRKFKY
jgi:hypothetical protein